MGFWNGRLDASGCYGAGVWCTFENDGQWVGRRRKEEQNVPGRVEFARGKLGFEPDERQAGVLASTAKRGILNCTRQWGKSTVAGIKAIHRAYTQPRSLVVVASPTERQSAEFVRKASEFVRRLDIAPRGD